MAETISCDFNKDTQIGCWLPRLHDIDAVINCAGILTGSRGQNIANIHYYTPLALFKACEQANIKRVIQLSALGIEDGPDIDYVKTKRQADEALLKLNLTACVLRPSLIYARGSYGGTSLLRALAAFPFVIPIFGSGKYRFQPVAMDDLTHVISTFLINDSKGVVDVVGPKTATIREIVLNLRQWLGFGKARILEIPNWVIKPLITLGDYFPLGPLNSVSYKMTLHENVADYQPLREQIDFDLTSFPDGLNYYPSQTQDRWAARLYFLKPLLTISLFLLWFFSGINPLLFEAQEAEKLLLELGFNQLLVTPIRLLSCGWDIILAFGLVFSAKSKAMGLLQLVTIGGYTLMASIGLTSLWVQPLAPLLKNIPILIAVLIWIALNDER